MAFEDRCSPQGAPSPPGLPHSPQNTTSSSEMMNQSYLNGSTIMLSQFNDRLSPIVIKQEEPSNEHISFQNHHYQRLEQPQPQQIRFSINNILSENFGKVNPSTTISSKKRCPEKKTSSSLFRPYDIASGDKQPRHIRLQKNHNQQHHHYRPSLDEIKLSQFRINHETAIIDFSRQPNKAKSPVPRELILNNTIAAEHKLFNSFSVQQSYPKIHEEILNSKSLQRQYQLSSNALSESSFAKIPPLGNLCKTVSQIGQPVATSCRSPSSSSASSTSSTSGTPVKCDNSPVRPKPVEAQQPTQQPMVARDSGMESSDDAKSETGSTKDDGTQLWPAWVYCTRYSDRPSSGPRYRKPKQPKDKAQISDEKRPRTAFSSDQLARLKREFIENRYLTERRRQQLSAELGLNEAQIKIWFQNKRAKIKKTSGNKNPLALQLMAQGLYNHSTVPLTKEEEELEMRMNGQLP